LRIAAVCEEFADGGYGVFVDEVRGIAEGPLLGQ
jgi:predicted RNase H-like HicB family nuclease